MNPSPEERVPRLLEVDLSSFEGPGALEGEPQPWSSDDPRLYSAGIAGGTALALARFLDSGRAVPAFALAVGNCVRRGLATAARATVVAPSPLTGRLAEGQVGSELGRRLASVADALVISGQTELSGAVLHVEAGSVRLYSYPELANASPGRTFERLSAELGEGAFLRSGPAGERGVPFANLAAGGEKPSFVGRGGLGAALGRTGLKAIAVTAPAVPASDDDELTRALLTSPRLRARGEGGTLELAQAFAARGDLFEKGYSRPLPPGEGARLSQEALESGRTRHGCKGCPTPCGWVFERSDGKRQGAHFSAVYALGSNLGLSAWDDTLSLLETCDQLGLDAKEAGAALALFARAVERGRIDTTPVFGNRERLVQLLKELVFGGGEGAALTRGAAAFAEEYGMQDVSFLAAGEAARPVGDLAAVLGQCVSPRGAEPMRTFPFLVGDGVPRERTEALLAPYPLPPGGENPRDPRGKGRLVWWHENLVAALDTSGFCAFSAAGLLSDGVLDLDALARLVSPNPATARGTDLLKLGATVVALHHAWNTRAGLEPDERPAWAAESLELAGMLSEYRRWRGLGEGGEVTPQLWRRVDELAAAPEPEERDLETSSGGSRPEAQARPSSGARPAQVPGCVTFAAWGPLRSALEPPALEMSLPATVIQVLVRLAHERPGGAPWLLRDGAPLAAVYRAGERLGAASLVHDGDRLDLVVAVSGGST